MPARSTPNDFWRRVDAPSTHGCRPWTGSKNSDGYGNLRYQGAFWLAHRLAWVLTRGAIPTDRCVCHRCDTPACCEPKHLFLGTQLDNMSDMKAKGRRRHINSGTRNGRAKLDERQAAEIRRLYKKGARQVDLAQQFHVSQSLVSLIVRREHWR